MIERTALIWPSPVLRAVGRTAVGLRVKPSAEVWQAGTARADLCLREDASGLAQRILMVWSVGKGRELPRCAQRRALEPLACRVGWSAGSPQGRPISNKVIPFAFLAKNFQGYPRRELRHRTVVGVVQREGGRNGHRTRSKSCVRRLQSVFVRGSRRGLRRRSRACRFRPAGVPQSRVNTAGNRSSRHAGVATNENGARHALCLPRA